ncbi:MAG: hypothetical protein NWE93_03360 [Candidatus Bathyarchaeota archaeon]|nr:hypothetical protein [Candidatus Bathyarchaeota archaeon]
MKELTAKIQPIITDSTSSEDKSTRAFVRNLIRKGVVEISPYLDKAGIRYPDAEDYFKDLNYSALSSIFESLGKQGVLKESASIRVLTCPHCNSPEVHSKFACPRCGSEDVWLTQLIEHGECGYIGARKDFLKDEAMVCPRCGTRLAKDGVDYRQIGNFYECEKCSNRFDRPDVIHQCLNCGKVSTYEDAKYIKVLAYKVNNAILSELTSEFPILERLNEFLEEKGFRVRLHDMVSGVSGTKSHFDLIANKDDRLIVIDVSIEGKKSDMVAFLAKKIDVNPTKALLLDLSGGNELTVLGKIYGIDVLGAKVDQDIPDDFKVLVDALLGDLKVKGLEK